MHRQVSTANAPKAIGPYSQAIINNGLVYTSGQIAIDPETQVFLDVKVEQQAQRVLENLKAVLEAAGSSMEKAVKVTIYLKDMNHFKVVNEVYSKYFINKPARSTVEVSSLPKGALIEIDCIASL